MIRMRGVGSPMVYCDKIVGKSHVSNELHWCIQHIIFVGVLETGLFHITPHAYDHSLPKSSANPLSLFIFINSQDIGLWITNQSKPSSQKISLYWHPWFNLNSYTYILANEIALLQITGKLPDRPEVVIQVYRQLCRSNFCHVQQYSGLFIGQRIRNA